jgi:hypothetical protein
MCTPLPLAEPDYSPIHCSLTPMNAHLNDFPAITSVKSRFPPEELTIRSAGDEVAFRPIILVVER